jgi:hypothetical protein
MSATVMLRLCCWVHVRHLPRFEVLVQHVQHTLDTVNVSVPVVDTLKAGVSHVCFGRGGYSCHPS